MPSSMALMYRLRIWIALATVLVVLALVWLVAFDLLRDFPATVDLQMLIGEQTGRWPFLDRTVRGMAGIETGGGWAAVGLLIVGLAGFFGSWVWFFPPWRLFDMKWLTDRPEQEPAVLTLGSGMLAGLMVSGGICLLQLAGYWAEYQADVWRGTGWLRGFAIDGQTAITSGILAVTWPAVAALLARWRRPVSRYWRRVAVIYTLFVGAGVGMLVTCLWQAWGPGFVGEYWYHGAYTALGGSTLVFVWTLGPAAALSWVAEPWWRADHGECIGCGYNLKVTVRQAGETCPECGAEIGPAVIRSVKRRESPPGD
ncbi:MAG: hypothetical protein R3336_08855 [Phycisphaeraceae bacterium]|nr:hypothetical protein [Phycisphaeraceae bacterium]